MTPIESAIAKHNLATAELEVVTDFLADSPALARAVRDGMTEPWIREAHDAVVRRVPIGTCMPFEASGFYRLPNHARCYYFTPPESPEGTPFRNVIGVKGTEPLTLDFDGLLYAVEHAITDAEQRRLSEHFAYVERKVPGALTMREAEAEASAALALQLAHLERYETLAHAPLPLQIRRLPADAARTVVEKVRRMLSPAAFSAIAHELEAGLAVYVYHYPSKPLRVSHADAALRQRTFAKRLEALRKHVDPEAAIDGWVRLFVRMLYLGFMPGSLASPTTGLCCDWNNSVLDGGFVDLDSIVPIDKLVDTPMKAVFLETLHVCFLMFRRTVRTLVAIREPAFLKEDLPGQLLTTYLHGRFRSAIESEARPGLTMDPRVVEYFAAELPLGRVLEHMGAHFAPFSLEDLFG